MPKVIVAYGEEEFMVEIAGYDAARSNLASSVHKYDFPDEKDEYLLESQRIPVDARARAYIITGAKEVPTLPANDSDVVILLCGKKPIEDKSVTKTLSFPKLKTFADNNEVVRWISKEGQVRNIDLSRVAGALFVNSGNCLRKLVSEIEKISVVVPPGSVVSPEQARSVMCFSAELTPKEIIEAVCDGYTVKALAYYDKLQERMDETGWILAYMQRLVIQQLRMEHLFSKKVPDDAAAKDLGVHPFIFKKLLISRRGLWRDETLHTCLGALCDADLAHKRGSDSAKLALESEIIHLSEEAKYVKRH